MTVSTINSVAEFVTNGATKTFPFYFKFLDSRDLVVTYIDPEDVSTVLVMGTQYTVSGAGNDKGGSVTTTAVLRGPGKLIVSRNMEAYQKTSLRNQGKFLAETHEDVFDRLTMLSQQGFSDLKRALFKPFGREYFYAEDNRITGLADPKSPKDAATKDYTDDSAAGVINYTDARLLRTVRSVDGETLTQLPPVVSRANKVMGFDANGQPIGVLPATGSGTELAIDLANSADPNKGPAMLGVTMTTPGALPTTVFEVLGRTYNVLDVLTPAERCDIRSGAGSIDVNAKLQRLLDSVPAGSRILFNTGVYLNAGAVGLIVKKSLFLEFQRGAVLKFNHNDAKYLQTWSSDVTLLSPQIDGGSTTWERSNNAGIRVRSNGAPVSNIEIIRPRIKNVAGAGLLVGWTDNISDVTIDNPVVRNSQADGVSVAYDTSDVSIMSPRCYNTGDDGVSIVSYLGAANPVRRVMVTDALSVDSKARGLTVIGGEDIKLTGKSINATAQGVLVIQDVGRYNTYAPKRIKLDVEAFNSTGIGIEIGRNAEDVSGSATAVGSRGTRGILIGSGAGLEPKRIIMSLLAAYDCTGIGVELGRVITLSVGVVDAVLNGSYGVLAANTFNLSVGNLNAYNNNTSNIPGADNIFYTGVINFSMGSATSTDDRLIPLIERTFDLEKCINGIIGSFNGIYGQAVNVLPNIQATCVNIRSSAEVVVRAGVPTAADIPVRGFYIDTANKRAYFSIDGVPRYASLI